MTTETTGTPDTQTSRFQLSLNVNDVEASVEFYTKLLGVGPAKHRTGYANFVVADPPLKLVIIEEEGTPGTINHVGIEFESGVEVARAADRASALGLPVEVDDPHTCCFATQEKAWTRDVDGVPWELYTVLGDTAGFGASPRGGTPLDVMLPPVDIDQLSAGLADSEVIVIDAQGPGGFEALHIPGALDFSLDTVVAQAAAEIPSKDHRVLLYCTDTDCLGSEFVGTQLIEAGYTNIGRFAGGVGEWVAAGQPVAGTEAPDASASTCG